MSAIVLLFIVGLVLLGLEVFVPGAILGIFGGLALLGGSALAFVHYGVDGGLLALAIAAVLVGALLYFEFRVLPRTAMGRRLFLHAAVTGHSSGSNAPALADVVGQMGLAATPLAPSGYVTVAGRRLEAYSRSGYIPAGAALKVVAADHSRVIVIQA